MKKLIATIALGGAFAVAGGVGSVGMAASTPTSPGACHMLEANSNGLAGMDGSQGGRIMLPLVIASLGAGCTP